MLIFLKPIAVPSLLRCECEVGSRLHISWSIGGGFILFDGGCIRIRVTQDLGFLHYFNIHGLLITEVRKSEARRGWEDTWEKRERMVR